MTRSLVIPTSAIVSAWEGISEQQTARRLRGLTTVLTVVLLALSCHPPSGRISLDNSSNGKTILVAPGDRIDITLQTVGPGQYETPAVSAGFIRFLGESSAGPPNPAGTRQLFRFEALTVGRAEITIPHTLLDPALPPIPPFAIVVDVR